MTNDQDENAHRLQQNPLRLLDLAVDLLHLVVLGNHAGALGRALRLFVVVGSTRLGLFRLRS